MPPLHQLFKSRLQRHGLEFTPLPSLLISLLSMDAQHNHGTQLEVASQQTSQRSSSTEEPRGIPIPRTRFVPRHPVSGRSLSEIPLAMGGPNLYAYDHVPPERPIVHCRSLPSRGNVSDDSLQMSIPDARNPSSLYREPTIQLPLRHTLERMRARGVTDYEEEFVSWSPPREMGADPGALLTNPPNHYQTCEYCLRRHSTVDAERHWEQCESRAREHGNGSDVVFRYSPMPRPSWLDAALERRGVHNRSGRRSEESVGSSIMQQPGVRQRTVVPSDPAFVAQQESHRRR